MFISQRFNWLINLFCFPNQYSGNHLSSVTAFDEKSEPHHYYLGGQLGDKEYTGNVDMNFEWDAINKAWVRRAPLPFARGHMTGSTRPISCGFFVAGGSANNFAVSSEVTYYDIETDSWQRIGELPNQIRTPICDVYGEFIYCQTGLPWSAIFSYRRKIIVP